MRVIAIDGPAGSGKSTVARAVAERLRLPYLDTGAMYRAVTLVALRHGVDPADAEAVACLARDAAIEVAGRVTVNGEDCTAEIRSAEVTAAVSAVAAHPGVRQELVRRQRQWAEDHGGGVVEGRDIGTVVFPSAPLKIYLTAAEDERARRRSRETAHVGYEEVAADLVRRDRLDSGREVSPLAVAGDAAVVDTTGRSIESVVEEVIGLAEAEAL